MSILEKKTGSGIDALIISLIMAKVFLLEYLGMAGIVNNVIFLLIGVRLIFSGWKIPKKLLFLVCLITMLLVLSYSAGSIVPGKTSYNLKAIQTFFFYALFIVMLKTNGSDLLDFGKRRWIVFFNVVYAVNCIVILIQVYYPYSLMAAAPMTGQIPFYEDLISGLFMYASTHAVALFSCFVLLIDLNSIRDGSGELRIPVVCCAAAVLASSLGIAALNVAEIAKALEAAGADGLSVINSIQGMAIDVHTRKSRVAKPKGGLSGPLCHHIAVRMVWEVAQAVDIPINGVGGVMTGEDAAEFILAGATCVSVGMANFVDPCASLKIAHELEAWAESQGVKDINELVGAFEC